MILVTGGAGFIGTNFVFGMCKQDYRIRVLDKLTYAGGKDNLESLGDLVDFRVGDVCDRQCVNKALEDVDVVLHFAAESHNTRSEKDPDIFFRSNVEGTRIMLEESAKVGIKKFIHISTDEVYGSARSGFFKETDKETGTSQATSAYSKSKSEADDLAVTAGQAGLPVIVTRTTNNFGPWQFPEKALPRWITNLLLGRKIPLWGEGLQVRDWLFAPNNVEAIEFILKNGKLGEVYNVAANHNPEITNRTLAEMVCRMVGRNPDEYIEYIPDPRPNHDFRYALDTTKIANLGWSPSPDFENQVEMTISWYRDHDSWWKKRKAEAEKIYK